MAGSKKKIRMIEERVGGHLAPLGFSVDWKTTLEIQFSRTIEGGVEQYIMVLLNRYADEVCARYWASARFERPKNWEIHHNLEQIEYMREHVPGWRPGEGEWVWYDGDADFPRALDVLVSVIDGYGLGFLEVLSRPSDPGESYEDEAGPTMPELRHRDPADVPKAPVRLEMGDDERTRLVLSTVGPALEPFGFSYYRKSTDSWMFRRVVHGSFSVEARDRRGLYWVDSDTAEQMAIVEVGTRSGLVWPVLQTNALYEDIGRRTAEVMGAFINHVQGEYPEAVEGYCFPYHDDASFAGALRNVTDVLVRYGVDALDALCERPEG